jgi:hypothetical protein
MTEPNSPVDPRLIDLLRAESRTDPAARARVRSKLAAFIPMGGVDRNGPGGDGRLASAGPPTAVPRATLASLGTRAVTFVMGGAVGVALYASLAKPPPPQVVYVDRPVPVPAASAPPSPAQLSAAQQDSVTAVAPAPHGAAPKSRFSQLSAERLILEEARAAIMQGEPQRGLERLEQHRRLFANPLLAEERDALQVQALVKAGRYDEARASADSFRKHAPDSIFLPMVDAAIASIP